LTSFSSAFFEIRSTIFDVLVIDLNLNKNLKNGIQNYSKGEKYNQGRLELLGRIGADFNHYQKETNGKPFLLHTEKEISFSHSKNLMAIQVSQAFSPGIDVELIREKIKIVSQKFLHQSEFFDDSFVALHIIWGAKEAIYKHWSLKSLSLISDIRIMPFEKKESGEISGILFPNTNKERHFKLDYHIINGFCLVYITQVILPT